MKINNITIQHNGFFAYDTDGNFYICQSESDIKNATQYDYVIRPINELKTAYSESKAIFKTIQNWKLTEKYARFGEKAVIYEMKSN